MGMGMVIGNKHSLLMFVLGVLMPFCVTNLPFWGMYVRGWCKDRSWYLTTRAG